jgi:hypothetical protein
MEKTFILDLVKVELDGFGTNVSGLKELLDKTVSSVQE